MDLKLQPSQKQIEDLRLLCASDKLAMVANRICEVPETVLSPADAKDQLDKLASVLGPEVRASLFRQAMGLRAVMTRGDYTSSEVMQSLLRSLEASVDFQNDLEDWKRNAQEPFQRIIDSRFIRIVSKSANLAYDFAYLLRTARIVTDARPIFSDSNGTIDDIDGVVVSHVLRLEYDNLDNRQSMSIVMDHLDVKKLRDACDRAIQKAEVVEQRFIAKDIPTKITGKGNK